MAGFFTPRPKLILNNMPDIRRALIETHVAIALIGLSGVFGKTIDLPPELIVLGRVLLGAVTLLLLAPVFGYAVRLKRRRDTVVLLASGVLLAFHWYSFFESIRLSTIAIALVTYATFPVFTTFIEPLVFRAERLTLRDILLAGAALAGVVLVVPEFSLHSDMTQGVLWGVACGLSFAVLSVLNRRLVAQHHVLSITLYQFVGAALVLWPAVFFYTGGVGQGDMLELLVLGVVVTAGAHSLFIHAMRHIRARTASIIAALEPVYGVVFAVAIVGEVPALRTVLGGLVIMAVAWVAGRQADANPA